MNMSLQQKFNLYSWIEPFHLIKENNNYNFELRINITKNN